MTYSNMWPRNQWALRHLNWAWVLYPLLANLICIATMVTILAILPNDATRRDTAILLGPIMFFTLLGWRWYLSVWNLRHKGRSLWNLLYLLIPHIGDLVFLCIKNKDQLTRSASTN